MQAEAVMEPTRLHRPDEDIAEDIAALIRSYDPLMQSRHWFTYDVRDGVVKLQGNINSAIAERVLLDNVPRIPGVEEVDAEELYNDEELRLRVGRMIPPGVLAHVDFGRVVLSGSLPDGHDPDAMIKRIEEMPGVRKVINQLW